MWKKIGRLITEWGCAMRVGKVSRKKATKIMGGMGG